MKKYRVLTVVVLIFFVFPKLGAVLLVYEGFDYNMNSPSGEWVGGSGLSGGWTFTANPGGHSAKICPGLSFGRLLVSGNSIIMSSSADVKGSPRFAKLQRSLNIDSQTSGTIWVSYLISRISGHSSGANAMRLMNAGSRVRDFTAEYKAFGADGFPCMHLFGKTAKGSFSTPNCDGEPVLVIASYEVGKSATAEMWIFDLGGFAAIYPKLDDGSVQSRDLTDACSQRVSLKDGGSIVVDSSDVIEFFQQTKFLAENDGGLIADYDELRIGTDMVSVLPLSEPTVSDAGAADDEQRRIVFRSGK